MRLNFRQHERSHLMGMGWTQALLFSTLLLMLYFIFTRIICETGIPFLSPDWNGNPQLIRAFLAGMALVVTFSVMRFKYSRFPIHPILFLVWDSWAPSSCWCSFMIGWFVKTLIVRMGGGGTYQRLKPLFIGVISGECVFIGLHIAYTLLYRAIFGIAPTVGVYALPT